jgi:hypothetical protein
MLGLRSRTKVLSGLLGALAGNGAHGPLTHWGALLSSGIAQELWPSRSAGHRSRHRVLSQTLARSSCWVLSRFGARAGLLGALPCHGVALMALSRYSASLRQHGTTLLARRRSRQMVLSSPSASLVTSRFAPPFGRRSFQQVLSQARARARFVGALFVEGVAQHFYALCYRCSRLIGRAPGLGCSRVDGRALTNVVLSRLQARSA